MDLHLDSRRERVGFESTNLWVVFHLVLVVFGMVLFLGGRRESV